MKTEDSPFWQANQGRLVELAGRKLRVREIAKRLDVTRNAVIGRCRRTGVALEGYVKTDAVTVAKVQRLYDEGRSYAEIAERAGVPKGAIGAKLRPDQRRNKACDSASLRGRAFKILAIAAHLVGEPQRKVAARLGFSTNRFPRWKKDAPLWRDGQAMADRVLAKHAERQAAIDRAKRGAAVEEMARINALNTPILAQMSLRHRLMMQARVMGRSYGDVAAVNDISRERVRQIEIRWRLRGLIVPGAAPLNLEAVARAAERRAAAYRKRHPGPRGRPPKTPVKDAAYWAAKVDEALAKHPMPETRR